MSAWSSTARSCVSQVEHLSPAVGYCTVTDQAEAPATWFEQALAYTTTKLHGAPAARPGRSRHGPSDRVHRGGVRAPARHPRTPGARVPASTWDALLILARDPADAGGLGRSAESRLLYCYAIPLYRHAADAGRWLRRLEAGPLAG